MIEIIHYIAIVQGLITGIVLFSIKRNGKHESKYLALFLLFLSFAIINESYGDYFDEEFHILYPFQFFLLLPNLIYLHINSKLIGSNSRKILLLNLLPGCFEFVILCLLLLLINLGILDSNSEFLFYFDEVYTYLTLGYTLFVQVIILKKIALYNRNLYTFLSTVHYKYLNWLKWVCIIIITNEAYYTLFHVLPFDVSYEDHFYMLYTIFELILIFYIGIGALLQVNLKIEIPLYTSDLQKAEKSDNTVTINSSDNETSKLFAEIESFMKANKPFLNPDLNLKSLSQIMNIPERQLSNAINQNSNQNFYSYINQYRVNTVKTMLANNDHQKYSIVGIGEVAGFNSKSSFYTNFKKATGISPSEYIKEMS